MKADHGDRRRGVLAALPRGPREPGLGAARRGRPRHHDPRGFRTGGTAREICVVLVVLRVVGAGRAVAHRRGNPRRGSDAASRPLAGLRARGPPRWPDPRRDQRRQAGRHRLPRHGPRRRIDQHRARPPRQGGERRRQRAGTSTPICRRRSSKSSARAPERPFGRLTPDLVEMPRQRRGGPRGRSRPQLN